MISIFIVDDDPAQSSMLKDFLANSERNILIFNSGEDCLKNLDNNPDLIFLDYNFDMVGPKAMNGVDILQEIKKRNPAIDVVMLSSQDKIEVAMNTVKYGAFDYIVKGETAFHRADNAITNIMNRIEMKSNLTFYKRVAVSMSIAVVVTLVVVFAVYKMAKAGWFN